VGLLTGQKSTYSAAIPGPLSRLESYFAAPAPERHVAPPPPPPPAPKSSIWRWLLPLLIALAVLWLLSRCMGSKEQTTSMAPPPAPVETAPAPQPMPAPMPEVPTADLPIANFYFDVDKFELPVAREGSLDAVIAYLLANPTAVAAVSGYHDPTGDAAHNAELAKQRAQSVKDAMMAAGVPESQIDMVEPIETTGSGDMAEARRVEVSIRR
jgi:outer membrane protein OmpA-like peptidoglycan-associated protein